MKTRIATLRENLAGVVVAGEGLMDTKMHVTSRVQMAGLGVLRPCIWKWALSAPVTSRGRCGAWVVGGEPSLQARILNLLKIELKGLCLRSSQTSGSFLWCYRFFLFCLPFPRKLTCEPTKLTHYIDIIPLFNNHVWATCCSGQTVLVFDFHLLLMF